MIFHERLVTSRTPWHIPWPMKGAVGAPHPRRGRRGHVAPPLGNERVKACFLRRAKPAVAWLQPTREQLPDILFPLHLTRILPGIQHDFPTPMVTRPDDVGARACGIAVLGADGGEFAQGAIIHQYVNDQPRFIESQVL